MRESRSCMTGKAEPSAGFRMQLITLDKREKGGCALVWNSRDRSACLHRSPAADGGNDGLHRASWEPARQKSTGLQRRLRGQIVPPILDPRSCDESANRRNTVLAQTTFRLDRFYHAGSWPAIIEQRAHFCETHHISKVLGSSCLSPTTISRTTGGSDSRRTAACATCSKRGVASWRRSIQIAPNPTSPARPWLN